MKHRRIPFCDHDWSRTSTSVRTLPPQSSASTNSATWPFSEAGAKLQLIRDSENFSLKKVCWVSGFWVSGFPVVMLLGICNNKAKHIAQPETGNQKPGNIYENIFLSFSKKPFSSLPGAGWKLCIVRNFSSIFCSSSVNFLGVQTFTWTSISPFS